MSYGACSDTRYSEMPGYGQLGFTEDQVNDLVEWVVDLSGGEADAAAVERAQATSGICAECHGADSYGYVPYGGPGLRDDIWLYGSSDDAVRETIVNGRNGIMPSHGDLLGQNRTKILAAYVYSLSDTEQ